MGYGEKAEKLLVLARELTDDPTEAVAVFALCISALCQEEKTARKAIKAAYEDMNAAMKDLRFQN